MVRASTRLQKKRSTSKRLRRPAAQTVILSPNKKHPRAQRYGSPFDEEQLAILLPVFFQNPWPDMQMRDDLARQLECPSKKVFVWFRNRRQMWRIRMGEPLTQETSLILRRLVADIEERQGYSLLANKPLMWVASQLCHPPSQYPQPTFPSAVETEIRAEETQHPAETEDLDLLRDAFLLLAFKHSHHMSWH